MRRLVGLAVALVAIPVMAWMVLGSGGHARGAAAPVHSRSVVSPRMPRVRSVVIPNQGGSSCFVAAGACSETPCVEYARSQSVVLVTPGGAAVVPSQRGRCPARAPKPARPATSGSISPRPGVVPIGQSVVTAALARASRALAHRTAPGGG